MDDLNKQNNPTVCHSLYFSWPAVFIGTLVGVGLSFLCFLLELAIGLTAFPTTASGALTFSVTGFVSLIVIAIVTMFIVGWITAYLGRPCHPLKYLGELYGFTAWSLSLILTIFLAAYVNQHLTDYSYLVNKSEIHLNVNAASLKAVPQKIENKIAAPKSQSENNADILAMTTFAIFSIFFISAISSCFGGRCAMLCRRNCQNKNCCG